MKKLSAKPMLLYGSPFPNPALHGMGRLKILDRTCGQDDLEAEGDGHEIHS